ncbi:RNA 2',3'-cyclic phosphodiesterase [Candidatus Woesearchaeota archaeon]|nr:RNA 2',3'-cyclic phosphodiesterase [Candidatus Woesearchaeota archaeon]
MVRLFVAIELPDDICRVLREFQKKLPGGVTKTSSFHLTLQFIGEVDDTKVPLIIESLRKVLFSSFTLSLDKVGVFPSNSNPRVVWIGVVPGANAVALAKQVGSCLAQLELVPDHEFHPHLTLARVKFLENKNEFLAAIDAWKVPPVAFVVNAFYLVKSTLSKEGSVYETLACFRTKSAKPL